MDLSEIIKELEEKGVQRVYPKLSYSDRELIGPVLNNGRLWEDLLMKNFNLKPIFDIMNTDPYNDDTYSSLYGYAALLKPYQYGVGYTQDQVKDIDFIENGSKPISLWDDMWIKKDDGLWYLYKVRDVGEMVTVPYTHIDHLPVYDIQSFINTIQRRDNYTLHNIYTDESLTISHDIRLEKYLMGQPYNFSDWPFAF